jgi:ABC-type antimicrobial peptide transport system permease subunit
MNFKGQSKLLTSNLKTKWLRTLIASGGIIIGIMCITITTTLSFGILDTITKALNSQFEAKKVNILFTKKPVTNIFELNREDVVAKSYEDIQKIKDIDSNIESTYPQNLAMSYTLDLKGENCQEKLKKISENPKQETIEKDKKDYEQSCINTTSIYTPFDVFKKENPKNWLGSTEPTKENETVLKYTTFNKEYFAKIGVNKAEEIVGKEFELSFQSISGYSEIGTNKFLQSSMEDGKKFIKKYKVIAVVDETKNENSVFSQSSGNVELLFNYNDYLNFFKETKSDIKAEKIGFDSVIGIVKSVEVVEPTLNKIKSTGLFATSPILEVLKIANIVFMVISGFLSAFGVIALIVSIFGIINVIAMSVLEKQKEIGILKSLGSSNMDIFGLFIGEGFVIGLIGWIVGTGLAVGLLTGANAILNNFILPSFPDFSKGLKSIGIDQILLLPQNWLYLVTFVIAIFFTVLSSFIPSIGAARKRPVDVLRNE